MPIDTAAWLCATNSLHHTADIEGLTTAAARHDGMYGISGRENGEKCEYKAASFAVSNYFRNSVTSWWGM